LAIAQADVSGIGGTLHVMLIFDKVNTKGFTTLRNVD
jgi:hypothetical protein